MVELILGVMMACCSGKTTASALTICEMSPILAGTTWTETSGTISGSLFEQADIVSSEAAIDRTRQTDICVRRGQTVREIMAW
jgi:hypothetical protein